MRTGDDLALFLDLDLLLDGLGTLVRLLDERLKVNSL